MEIALALVVAALICTIISAIGKMPLWPSALLLCLVHLLGLR
jgi:hypothetical protein